MLDMLSIWFLVKIGFLVLILFYLVFAVVVVKQIYLMTATFKTGFEFPLRSIAWAHLLVATGIFIVSLVIL